MVEVKQGGSYAKCPVPRALDFVCEAGATAVDEVEGDLTAFVTVCDSDDVQYVFSQVRFAWQECSGYGCGMYMFVA